MSSIFLFLLKHIFFTGSDLLFVIGSTSPGNAEIVDLSGTNRICPEVSEHPSDYGMFGTFIGGSAITCGGFSPSSNRPKCYEYLADDDAWVNFVDMSLGRYRSATEYFNETSWWITGGGTNGGDTKTTEMYDSETRTLSYYVDIPIPRELHNLVKMDDNRMMLLGGLDQTSLTFIFDKTTEEWTNGPPSPRSHEDSYAGRVTYPNGTSAIIIAGDTISDIFNLDTEVWTEGPNLPYFAEDGCSVQRGDSFLLIGGNAVNEYRIATYNVETNEYELLSATFENPKRYCTAYLVPEDFVTCS